MADLLRWAGRLVWKAWLMFVVLLAAMQGAQADRCYDVGPIVLFLAVL
jgi:hypothetical protein